MTEKAAVAFGSVCINSTALWMTEGFSPVMGGDYDIYDSHDIWDLFSCRDPEGKVVGAIKVWEGTIVFVDDNPQFEGSWREPTEEEWLAIREKRNPWTNQGGANHLRLLGR